MLDLRTEVEQLWAKILGIGYPDGHFVSIFLEDLRIQKDRNFRLIDPNTLFFLDSRIAGANRMLGATSGEIYWVQIFFFTTMG